ncbi:hypothetical protein [Rhodoferax sp. U11-2br]|uniref:hypothetical protein n=1 Tax=Rhodoferax sp. U11-2br TaxID=2838878 RepID=UPI001BE9B853|nr:hypothetical protein [Rhodoferax sp. U11-2br]MBT3066966.1 hypothetical protein [Rhodoferax sp. U11-2br]
MLTHAQSVALVAHWQGYTEAHAETFMQEAAHHDLEGLLNNPQTLRLLVKALNANNNKWPDSKTSTYEMACAQLVREFNEEHLANSRDSTPPDDQTLLAAGYLCAVMLLSASGSIALQRQSEPRSGVVALPDLKNTDSAPDLPTCRFVLHTRLFRGDGTGDFRPVHRTVAEYLGAHYLASRIQAGLPVNRVLALMLGQDGGLVPELRGLHAWLAAVAPPSLRRVLISHDPLGVVLNGDVRAFSHIEKLAVLAALQHEATQDSSFRRQNWASHPFGALATPDMEGDFRALLQSPERSQAHQALLDCVLDAIKHGQPIPALAPLLEQVVRDKSYQSGLRTTALDALVAGTRHDKNYSKLALLLADIHNNEVEDLQDELLGTLLDALYPSHISPSEIWRYFQHPKTENFLGVYRMFWHDLPKRLTAKSEVATSLDALVLTNYQLKDEYDPFDVTELIGDLLVQGISQHGENIDVARLYRWLGLSLGEHFDNRLQPEHAAFVKQWLEARPAVYKALFEYGLGRQTQENLDTGLGWWRINAMFHGAATSADGQNWYLSLAEKTTNDDWRHQLIFNAIRLVEQAGDKDAGTALLRNWKTLYPADAQWVEVVLEHRRAPPEPYPGYQTQQNEVKEKLAQRQREKTTFFQKHLPEFETGPAHLGALVEVANAYLNNFRSNNQATPEDRLLKLLNQDPEWVRLALHGLRQCLFREDLPSADDIIALAGESRRYHLATPCVAAMVLREAEDPATTLDLSAKTLETVVAFQLTNLSGETPSWFKRLLTEQVSVVAKVMLKYIQAQIAAKNEHVNGPSALAHSADYAAVAQQITLPLLMDFPTKAYKALLPTLQTLILAAMRDLTQDVMRLLTATKLANKTLDVGQHVYWLATGLQLDSDTYLEPMRRYVGNNQTRIHHVFNFFYQRRGERSLGVNLPPSAQIFLVGLLGPKCSPEVPRSGIYEFTAETEIGSYVGHLIQSLANTPEDAATQALIDFQRRPELKQWHDTFKRALYDQRISRRKALFQPATVKQVCNTLANLQPASAADLWALTLDHLTQLASEIRNGSTNDYRQYWANDEPKLENDCRDALLSDLKQRLATVGVAAEREGNYADDKRADIKVIASPHHVPIEVKRETHPDLWKAIGSQLIAKYARESASDGYGIYLVFWFSGKLMPAAGDGGNKPKTPQELQQRLIATLPEALKRKIAVLVVDCSNPSSTKSI